MFPYKEMALRDFVTRWDQALTSVSEVPKENVLESLYKRKIQTVLAMYEEEIHRDRAMPSYRRLKTMVRRHIDQLIKTRNHRARRVLVKSH